MCIESSSTATNLYLYNICCNDSKRFNCMNPDIRQANIRIADNLHGLGNRIISGYYYPDFKPRYRQQLSAGATGPVGPVFTGPLLAQSYTICIRVS